LRLQYVEIFQRGFEEDIPLTASSDETRSAEQEWSALREKWRWLCSDDVLSPPPETDTSEQHEEYAEFESSKGEKVDSRSWPQVLEVAPDASIPEIKAAFHKLLKQYHPGTIRGLNLAPEFAEFAGEKTKMIVAAYEQARAARRF